MDVKKRHMVALERIALDYLLPLALENADSRWLLRMRTREVRSRFRAVRDFISAEGCHRGR